MTWQAQLLRVSPKRAPAAGEKDFPFSIPAIRTLPPLDLSGGTDFQRSVWDALRKIPAGKTRSYGEIAREIGRPRAVRAVGQACGANPIPDRKSTRLNSSL